MRQTLFMMKDWARAPQRESKVPFFEQLPLVLKNRVSGKVSKVKERGCLHEISLVLSCLLQNNYEDKFCTKEVTNFQKCYHSYLDNRNIVKEHALKGILTPNAKSLTHTQVNKLLRKYPHV